MEKSVTQKTVLTLPVGRHKIADNFYLKVGSDGSRQYVFRYQMEGKRKEKSIGSARKLTLKEAGAIYAQLLAKVRSGESLEKIPRQDENKPITFAEFAPQALAKIANVKRWSNKKHAAQWASTVNTYAIPIIGDMPVSEIDRAAILKVLSPIWVTKNETASRLRGRLERILFYAKEAGLIHDNPAAWRGGLDLHLASPAKFKTHKHHAALSLPALKALVPKLLDSNAITFKAILFGTLTASRAGEFAHAKWCEIDLKKKVWSVPPERRKDRKPFPHRVPLSKQAVTLLKSLERKNDYLFPATDGNKPINQYTPGQFVRRLTKESATMHGMRSVFRDWAAEGGVPDIVAEKCLMHATGLLQFG